MLMLDGAVSFVPTLITIFAAVMRLDFNAGCLRRLRIAFAAATFRLDPVPRPVAYIFEDGNSGNVPSKITTLRIDI